MHSFATSFLKAIALSAVLASSCAFGQITMSLASGSGNPGSAVVLNLSMSDPNLTNPASLQWVMTYSNADFSAVSVVAGSAATAAGKSITCNTTVVGTVSCAVWGANQTPISSGVVATVTLTIATSTLDTSSSVQLISGQGSTGLGAAISSTNSGSVVTIVQATPTLTGISCNPTFVSGGQSAICTVTLSSPVTSGSFTVGLSNSSPSVVTVPASFTISGSNSGSFTLSTVSTSTTIGVTITATAGTVIKTAAFGVNAACTYTLTPTTRLFAAGGGSTTVNVTTGSGCAWTATTNAPTWLVLQSGGVSGNGNGSFVYTVAANLTSARLGAITVGGVSFQVMEGGLLSIVPFNDVLSTDPDFDYVSLMSNYGITVGCQSSPPLYCPTVAVTRAEMAVFVVRGLDLATGATLTFPPTAYFQDVPATGVPDSQFFDFVQRIAQLGITVGCQTTPALFCPDESITEGEMAVFMIRGWMQANNTTTFTYPPTPYFTDVPATDEYFAYIQKMAQMGFWTGCTKTTYCESSSVTRDQMAPMVMRALLGAP